jgi:hypothetical protein
MTSEAELVVSNTPERVAEIKARIAEILREDAMSAAEASRLRGRLSFSNSQAFGREGAYAFLALGKRATGPGAKTGLSNSLTEALRWWADRFDSAKPRRVRMRRDQSPVFLFTDGSCEDEGGLYPEAAVGGVLYDPKDGYVKAFGGDLPTEVLAKLSPGGHKRQVVGQAELFPCWAARVIWKERLRGRPVVHMIDNEAAKFALIKGTTSEPTSAWITQLYWSLEVELECSTWLERVPSVSNCADGPRRGRFNILGTTKLRVRKIQLSKSHEKDLANQWKNERGPWPADQWGCFGES